ncbi:unnamed protein product, partial [Agarophyton chilense]
MPQQQRWQQHDAMHATHALAPRNACDQRGRIGTVEYDDDVIGVASRAGRSARDVRLTLCCSLEQLFFGATRRIRAIRRVARVDGSVTREQTLLTLTLRRGAAHGDVVRVRGAGDRVEGGGVAARRALCGHALVIVHQSAHARFVRHAHHLAVCVNVPLAAALRAAPLSLRGIDGALLHV